VILRLCSRAGLPLKRWHAMRHTFGTHAALLGVNPWRLQVWLGHQRIDETMIYVHVAENHRREIPEHILIAAAGEADPGSQDPQDARSAWQQRGSNVAADAAPEDERAAKAAL